MPYRDSWDLAVSSVVPVDWEAENLFIVKCLLWVEQLLGSLSGHISALCSAGDGE